MLFYSSLHPDWDYSQASSRIATLLNISSLLEILAINHPRNTASCMDELEQQGIILGNGGTLVIRVQNDPFGDYSTQRNSWANHVVAAARAALPYSLWLCCTISGSLMLIASFPRMAENSEDAAAVQAQLPEVLAGLSAALLSEAPDHRLTASDLQFDEGGIFRCCNTIRTASDYYDFLTEQSRVVLLDSEAQLHNAFANDLTMYRQFSGSIARQLLQRDPPEVLSRCICDRILQNSSTTMESLRHHLQLFTLTFLDFLGASGLVDSSYIERQNIAYRVFQFENEAEFRRNFLLLIQELADQNRLLQAVGKQQQIVSVREYIAANITDPSLTLTGVADHFGLTTAQIAKQFNHYFGITPYRFLQQLRLNTAQRLLQEHPDMTMQEIAGAAGYTDLTTMYRAFKKYGSTTPAAYRGLTSRRPGAVPEADCLPDA